MNIEINTLLKPGIFCIRDTVTNKVYLTYSNSPLSSVARIIEQIDKNLYPIKDLNVGLDRLEIRYIKEVSNRRDGMMKLQESINTYRQDGYQVLNRRNSLIYKLSIEVDNGRVFVYLRSKNNSKILVGLFKKFKEAQSWLNANYPDCNNITNIVYCNSLEYRQFIKKVK